MGIRNILNATTICVLLVSFKVAAAAITCVPACSPPATTITSYTTTPAGTCTANPPPAVTTTCTDNLATISSTAFIIYDCSPIPSVTLPFTRCPTKTTTWTFTPSPNCPTFTTATVTECPEATGTVTLITSTTLGYMCLPTRKTVTIIADPTGTDTLPTCTPEPTKTFRPV